MAQRPDIAARVASTRRTKVGERPEIDIAERHPEYPLNWEQDLERDGDDAPAGTLDGREDLQKAIMSAIKKHNASGKANDMGVVGAARDQRNYYRGIQFSVWNEDAQDVIFVDDDGPYNRTFNISQAYGKIFISTFMGARPKVEPEPDNAMDSESVQDTSRARDYEQVWRKKNDIDALQMEIARVLWLDGRIISIDLDTPNGVKTRTYGVLESRAPGYLRGKEDSDFSGTEEDVNESPVKSWPMFETEDEFPLVTMKRKYPDARKKLNSGAGDSYYRNARLAVKRMVSADTTVDVNTGEDASGLCTITCTYMRPDFYEHLEESDRKEMESIFPAGCCIVRNGEHYLESFEFDIDAHVDVIYAIPTDGSNGPALVSPLMNVQDSVNTSRNLIEETFDHGIPTTYWDQETNIDTIPGNRNQPGGSKKMVRRAGDAASAHFYSTPELNPSPQLLGYAQQMEGQFAQFVTGLPPVIQGFGDSDQKTSSGQHELRQMALGQMAIVWKPYTSWYTRTMSRSVRLASKGQNEITATLEPNMAGAQRRNVRIKPSELRGFKYTNTSDENFPETWTERRNALMTVLQDPEAKQALMQIPSNVRLIARLTGLNDLVWPGEDSGKKQLQEIAEMQRETPVVDPAKMPQQEFPQIGAPPPQITPDMLTSSIPVSKYDDDVVEEAECLRWINSSEGQEARRTRPDWYQNVCLHCDLHTAQKQQKAQAAAPPPEPPKPPSVSIAYADLPADAKTQALQQVGITTTPDAIQQQAAQDSVTG